MTDTTNKTASPAKAELSGLPEDMVGPYRNALHFIAICPMLQMEEATSAGLADLARSSAAQLDCCMDLVTYVFALPRAVVQEDLNATAAALAEVRGLCKRGRKEQP